MTSLVIAPAGFASGGVVLALFGASASAGCGSACGCHSEAHANDDHDHADDAGEAHDHALHVDEHLGVDLGVDGVDQAVPGSCPVGCDGDTEDEHGPCPEGCDGCACSATVGVARLTEPPTMLHRTAVSTRVAGHSATGHNGVIARIFKPPKRSQA